MKEIKVTEFSDATNTIYRAEAWQEVGTELTVSMSSSWDSDGGQFPAADLDVMIKVLTDLRDKLNG